jgi:ElaB/YqjD/DUF883 family membrane-anchored ribosome-binding protein
VGETAAQIEQLIGRQRDQLESDVQQLQSQLRSMVDWRLQVRRHPWGAAATAFAATYLVGMMLGSIFRRI